MKINSETKLTGVIGFPLDKTLSPVIQNAAFEARGFNWCYVPMPVDPLNLQAALKGLQSLGFKGVNVTMPHKEAVIPFLDEIATYAELAGAVNTVHFEGNKMVGYNTDGRGFLYALENDAGFAPEGKSAVILGAGGAARSIAVILAMKNIGSLTIVNRTIEKAQMLVESLKQKFVNCDINVSSFEGDMPKIIDSTELIVNSTPLGWHGELVVDPQLLNSGHLVADLVYIPEETELLKAAKARGARILPGKLMLLYQGAESWEIWTEGEAPLDVMRKVLDEELSRDETHKRTNRPNIN